MEEHKKNKKKKTKTSNIEGNKILMPIRTAIGAKHFYS